MNQWLLQRVADEPMGIKAGGSRRALRVFCMYGDNPVGVTVGGPAVSDVDCK